MEGVRGGGESPWRPSFQKTRVRAVMFFDKESGVRARGTVRVPARGMTGRSVRKKQQPPSLERQELCYADGQVQSTVSRLA